MSGGRYERTASAVRPYVITGGRTGTAEELPSLETLVIAVTAAGDRRSDAGRVPGALQPEYRRIVERCAGLLSVAEVAAHLGQPPHVVQVLVADLVSWGRLETRGRAGRGLERDRDLLRKVLHGLEDRL